MQRIALISAKGGVGKTSCTLHLGGTLAAMGHRVLLVDCDAQSSLSQGFFGSNSLRSLDPESTIAEAWRGSPLPEQIIHPTGLNNLSLIPGHESASKWDLPLIDERLDGLSIIDEVLRAASDDYDFCLIDCPPQMYASSYAAMIAASHVIVPVQCEDYGSTGMVKVNRAIRLVQGHRGGPETLGFLLSMFDSRLSIHHAYADSLTEIYGELVFATRVPLLSAYKESVAARRPISHFRPRSPAGRVFELLADEIQRRLSVEVRAA